MSLEILRSLAADCREHGGEDDVADAIDKVISNVSQLLTSIKAEREERDKGDTIAELEARLRTTFFMVELGYRVPANASKAGAQ